MATRHQPGDCHNGHWIPACRSCCARVASVSMDLFDKEIRPKLREHHIGDALRFDLAQLKDYIASLAEGGASWPTRSEKSTGPSSRSPRSPATSGRCGPSSGTTPGGLARSARAREQQIRQKLIASLEKSGSLKAGAPGSPSPLNSLPSLPPPLSMPAPTEAER